MLLKLKPTVHLFLDTRRALAKKGRSLLADNLKDELYPAKLRATFQTLAEGTKVWKQKLFSLEIYCTKAEWRGARQSRNRTAKQDELRAKLIEAEKKALTIIAPAKVITVEEFTNLFSTSGSLRTVASVYDVKIGQLKKANAPSNTISFYEDGKKAVGKYAPFVTFLEVNPEWLRKFEKHLSATCNATTIGMIMISLRTVYNIATKELNVLSHDLHYPFGKGKYVITTGTGSKYALTLAEKNRLEEYKPATDKAKWAVDMWLFSFYAYGLNPVDIFDLKWHEIKNDTIVRDRIKTKGKRNTELCIPVTSTMRAIIKRHGDVANMLTKDACVFPIYSEGMDKDQRQDKLDATCGEINDEFVSIEKELNFGGHVTCYVARHTFACVSRELGKPIEFISACLGHATIAMTQRYLKGFASEVNRAHSEELVGKPAKKKKQSNGK